MARRHDILTFSLAGTAVSTQGVSVKWELRKGTVYYSNAGVRKRFKCQWPHGAAPNDISLHAHIQAEVERLVGAKAADSVEGSTLPCKRAHSAVDRFDQSAHASWTDSDHRKHDGTRNARVRPPGESYSERGIARDEAQAEAAHLRQQLSQLQAKICALIQETSDTHIADDPMERTAAVLLHSSLQELLLSSDLPVAETASAPVPTVITARWGGASGPAGELRVLPSQLLWVPVEVADGDRVATISLESIDTIDDEDDVSAVLILDLMDGDRIRLDFGSTGAALARLMEFERRLHAARNTALEAAAQTPAAKEKAAQRETRRVREGRALREGLQAVSKLKSADRPRQAQAKLDSLHSGKAPAQDTVNKRAFELASQLFKVGNFELTQAVLTKFLSLRDVTQLLPDAVRKTRQQAADAATAVKLLETAKSFFTVIMGVKGGKGGRRSDVNMNAFWASAASLLPRDVLQTRHGRAAARLLGIPYRVIKRASAIRADLEDSGVGWKLIQTKGHSDCVDGRLIAEFWHSDAASTEDNQNKEPVTIYDGFDQNGNAQYAIHWRRAPTGGWKQIMRAWLASPQCAQLQKETVTPKRPRGITAGKKLLKKFRCPCIKSRGASECDDTITTFVTVNLPLWHRARAGYHQPSMGDCNCHICSDAELRERYRGMSSSLWSLQEALLPCGRQHFAPYDIPGEKPFLNYRGCCVSGKCPKKDTLDKRRRVALQTQPWALVQLKIPQLKAMVYTRYCADICFI